MGRPKNKILGMCVGDGNITNANRLIIRHGIAQKAYAEHKAEIIGHVLHREIATHEYEYNGYPCVQLAIQNQYFRIVRKWLYPGGKKVVSRRFLNKLSPEAIAYWYMDDGSLYAKKRLGVTHTHELVISTCFDTEAEAQIVIDYFREIWGVGFTIKRNKRKFSIRCGKKNASKFIDIVKPFVIPSMQYKVLFSL